MHFDRIKPFDDEETMNIICDAKADSVRSMITAMKIGGVIFILGFVVFCIYFHKNLFEL